MCLVWFFRCLWAEIELDEAMFLQMVELLHHLGLACHLPTVDPDNFDLLVPWFLTDYPDEVEGLSENLTDDKVKAWLLVQGGIYEFKEFVH